MLARTWPGVALVMWATMGCRSERPASASVAPALVAYTATDHSFSGPARVRAGLTTIRMINQGKEPHHLVLVRLEEGKSFDDLMAALKQPGPPPTWVQALGGPNAADGGSESNATLALEPGQHAAICFIPGPDGVPHLAKGMVTKLEVLPAASTAVSEPAPDVVLKLSDYAFTLSQPVRAGTQMIRVENAGPQQHEVVIARLASGKSMADLVAWVEGGERSPPPMALIGGAAPMDRGRHNTIRVDFTAGDYVLLCFIPDAKDGKPHLAHGMATAIRVQ